MIPSNLIDLIERGHAKYKTWVVGATGSSRIPVPKNNYIVITDFQYSHFVDRNFDDETFDIAQALKNIVHHVSFKSNQQERIMYTIRSAFRMEFYEGNNFIVPVVPETKFDTYQVHSTDVHIDIWRLPDFSNWVMSISRLSDMTAEQPGPLGYGTQNNGPYQNVLRSIEFSGVGTEKFVPYGNNQGVPLTAGWREQFFGNIDNNTFLNPPATGSIDCNYTYPIINIGYVLVNRAFDKTDR
jgi:hypothetical protein